MNKGHSQHRHCYYCQHCHDSRGVTGDRVTAACHDSLVCRRYAQVNACMLVCMCTDSNIACACVLHTPPSTVEICVFR